MIRSMIRNRPPLALFPLALMLLGCPLNPATGERQLILISEAEEVRMGRDAAEQVEATWGLYDDPALQAYVDSVGQKLAAASEKPGLPWTFKVVDDPVVNAFALPGGFIFLTRGILTHFNSEAEMAAVLGHEIGHVTARHSAEQLSRAQVANLGVGVGSILSSEVMRYRDALTASLSLLFLKFGRDDERQADDLGFRYMGRGRYEQREMVDVFVMLGRVSEAAGAGSIPSWLSTHPDPGERQERIDRALAEAGNPTGGEVGRDRYLHSIDGVVFGDNPRNGFFRGQTFLHPDLEFLIEFPAGWQTQNTAAVIALSPQQDALIQLTLAEGSSAQDAAEIFFSNEAMSVESSSGRSVHGFPARWARFSAETNQGQLRGVALFLEYGGRIYQILGYTPAAKFASYDADFRSSLGSFDRLTDPEALSVQPNRVRLVKTDRAMTIEQFARRYPSTLPLARLALINGVEDGETIPTGTVLKRVAGGPVVE